MVAGMDQHLASRLRKTLGELRAERDRLEEELLQSRRVIRGSLVERSRLSGGKRRSTPALYLSVPQGHARNRSHYVRRAEMETVRRDVGAYRRYRQGLQRVRTLGREILTTLKALGRSLEAPYA